MLGDKKKFKNTLLSTNGHSHKQWKLLGMAGHAPPTFGPHGP